jgi:hypothetical protein
MSERTAVYRMFDSDDALLYVGMTKNFGQRWQSEAKQMPWWPEVSRQTVEWHPSREDAGAAERKAIRDECPRYNVRGVPFRLRQSVPPSVPLIEWSDGDRATVIERIGELAFRADVPHAEFRLLVANWVTTGKADLPTGNDLSALAHSCGVSRASAYRYRAEATERLANQKPA